MFLVVFYLFGCLGFRSAKLKMLGGYILKANLLLKNLVALPEVTLQTQQRIMRHLIATYASYFIQAHPTLTVDDRRERIVNLVDRGILTDEEFHVIETATN